MKYIAIVILALTVQSCGVFKNKTKHVTRDKIEVKEVKESEVVKDVVVTEVDKGVVIEEKVEVKEVKRGPLKTIAKGVIKPGVNLLTDSIGREFIAIFDELSSVLQVTIDLPEVNEKTTTTTKKQENKDSTKNEVHKEAATVRDEKVLKSDSKVIDKESKPNNWSFIAMWVGLSIFAIAVLWFLFKGRKL